MAGVAGKSDKLGFRVWGLGFRRRRPGLAVNLTVLLMFR
jgi:hypothetical protein